MIAIPPYTFVLSEELPQHPLLQPIEKPELAPQPESESLDLFHRFQKVLGGSSQSQTAASYRSPLVQTSRAQETEPQPMDLFHRIQRVCEENARDYLAGQRSQHIQALQEAEQRYADIDAQLCAACDCRPPLFSLYNFSLGKNGITASLPTQRGLRRTLLQQQTMSAILQSNLGIRCSDQSIQLYLNRLRSLLYSLKLSPWEKALRQQIQQGNPQASYAFECVYAATEYFDGHLVLLNEPGLSGRVSSGSRYPAFPVSHLSYHNEGFYSRLTRAQRRTLFAALKEEQKKLQAKDLSFSTRYTVPSARISLNTFDLLFCGQEQTCAVRYDKDQGKLISHTSPVGYLHTQKFIPLTASPNLAHQALDFLQPLFTITGGQAAAIDAFSQLLAGIAAPTPRKNQLWVVYTKHNRALIREILYQVFDTKAFGSIPPVLRGKRTFTAPPPPPKRPRAFLSTLLQANRLPVLLSAQVQGMCLILADDKLPTPTQELLFRNLTQGKKVSIQDEYDATLSFRNQMHIVYVTDNEPLSRTLTKDYRATLVDLSPYEKQNDQPAPLTKHETQWIQRHLFLHGCISAHTPVPRTPPKGQPTGMPSTYVDQSIREFLNHQCQFSPDLRCSRDQLYEAYADYCRRVYGQEPTDTPIRIIKKIRSQLPEDVVYKVARCGPENKSLSSFVGLGLQPTPYTPDPTPQEAEEQKVHQAFRAYLEKIQASVKDVLPDIPFTDVSVSRPDLPSKSRLSDGKYPYNPPTVHHDTTPPPPPTPAPSWNPPY